MAQSTTLKKKIKNLGETFVLFIQPEVLSQ